MIGYLKGRVLKARESGTGIIEVNGVGYEVSVVEKLEEGSSVELYIKSQMRESELTLYGFRRESEQEMFTELIKVSGIGARTAFNIIRRLGLDGLIEAINERDETRVSKVPGVGKKTAQRIMIELTGKVAGEMSERKELAEALEALGYSQREITDVMRKIPKGLTTEESLKKALKELG